MSRLHSIRPELLGPRALEVTDERLRSEFTEATWRGKFAFSVYGEGNTQFQKKKLVLLGRMLVETKMDHYAVDIKRVLREILDSEELGMEVSEVWVVDPFAGSGNLLYHVSKMYEDTDLVKVTGVGYELDGDVYKAAAGNFAKLNTRTCSELSLVHADSMNAVLDIPHNAHVVVLVDPPWAETEWSEGKKLSLSDTTPAVPDILKSFKERLSEQAAHRRLLFAIPCPTNTTRDSITALFKDIMLPISVQEMIPTDHDIPLHTLVVGMALP
eukprot:TRINITY_DN7657_c0_g1_i1.p1 TRINITY_DN7657_c0_g1~~TRINITY_DN7657_c0_g1_i1.p1  ORF type:complete len:270 (+),score=77.10 TRINITY_DN7657_c0_g1_i1:620-1429(+)